MRIAIVGAGAIGTWLGVRLANAGFEVSVLARAQTLEAIKHRGLRLVMGGATHTAMVKTSDRATELGVQDLIVLAVKGAALENVAPALGPLLGPNTTVLSAMNGIPWWFFHGLAGPMTNTSLQTVDVGGVISRMLPPEQVLGCVVYAACSTAEPAAQFTNPAMNSSSESREEEHRPGSMHWSRLCARRTTTSP